MYLNNTLQNKFKTTAILLVVGKFKDLNSNPQVWSKLKYELTVNSEEIPVNKTRYKHNTHTIEMLNSRKYRRQQAIAWSCSVLQAGYYMDL